MLRWQTSDSMNATRERPTLSDSFNVLEHKRERKEQERLHKKNTKNLSWDHCSMCFNCLVSSRVLKLSWELFYARINSSQNVNWFVFVYMYYTYARTKHKPAI